MDLGFFKRADLDLKIGLGLDLDLDLNIADLPITGYHLRMYDIVWGKN